MRPLLFLAHRIPYPPDKGDKIRSWHMLRHLAQRWRVHLGAFIDDPDDWRHVEALRAESGCAEVFLRPLNPRLRKLMSLRGLLLGQPLSLPYYADAGLQAWVDAKLADGMRAAVLYSSVMARYVLKAPGLPRIMDFVDIDSDKWRQYAPTQRWPMSWVYRREGTRLLQWERRVARACDASLFVSAAEARDFRLLAPESEARIDYLNNGVDTAYFSPDAAGASPYPDARPALVFTGAMDYWPNADAVIWFAREALPLIRAEHPDCVFYIVGSRPGADVQALAGEHVVVTGRVPDVRPYLAHAAVVVAPLRIARGIQNKVLEGMAMARTVVASPQALEGIAAKPGAEILVAEDGVAYAQAVLATLRGKQLGEAARARVMADYAWTPNLEKLDRLLEQAAR